MVELFSALDYVLKLLAVEELRGRQSSQTTDPILENYSNEQMLNLMQYDRENNIQL